MEIKVNFNNGELERQQKIIDIRKKRKSQEIVKYIKLGFTLIMGILIIAGLLKNNFTNAYDGDKLLNYMNLPECRITQDEESHLQKGNGSMYAYDIACIRGKSFEVFTPNYKNIYIIKYIGYDEKLGNYVTIKHGNLYFIYGHTKTDLKVGTALKNGVSLGFTDKSGISENYHLHLELWEDNNNISFAYLEGKGSIIAEKSFQLREQRNWLSGVEINNNILDFIKQFEGVRLEAYWDITHYSIGFGTSSFKGETISLKEAEKRARIEIQKIKDEYNLHNYSLDVQKAVVSFVYNIGSLDSEQLWLLENSYYTALGNNFLQYNGYYNDEGKKIVLGGLIKRRTAEKELL